MMNKYRNLYMIFCFCFINQSFSFSKENDLNRQPHGTLIVTVICHDGILIASDSRASFTTGKGKSEQVYAYTDNNQKIFTIGSFKIGMSGITMFNKKFIYDIIERFNKTNKEDSSIENTFKTFKNYLNTKMKVSDSTIFSENQFIIAGYENQKPITIGVGYEKYIKETRMGGLIHSDKDFEGYLEKPKNIDLTCNNIAPILESAIIKFAKDKNDNKIGGAINIIQIKPNNTFIEKKAIKTIKFKTYKTLANAILSKKLHVVYLFPYSEELLKKTLTDGVKLGY
jgi:hypothetical protein